MLHHLKKPKSRDDLAGVGLKLNPAWEFCRLRDGRGVIHSIYGDLVTVPAEKATLLSALQLLAQKGKIQESELAQCNPRDTGSSGLRTKLQRLASLGVVDLYDPRIKSSSPLPRNEQDRFQPVMDIFSQLGGFSQAKAARFQCIRQARIGLIGLGAVGSLLAMMFAATGAGYLRIIDGDQVEDKNLTRQLFYGYRDMGGPSKSEVIRREIASRSDFTEVDGRSGFVQSLEQAEAFAQELDMVILTADQPRIILHRWVNAACAGHGTPLIYTFVDRVGPFYLPGRSACFACLEEYWRRECHGMYDEIVENLSAERPAGFPSFVAGPVQCAHAIFMEAMGLLTGAWRMSTINRLLIFNFPEYEAVEIPRRKSCPVCGPETLPSTSQND